MGPLRREQCLSHVHDGLASSISDNDSAGTAGKVIMGAKVRTSFSILRAGTNFALGNCLKQTWLHSSLVTWLQGTDGVNYVDHAHWPLCLRKQQRERITRRSGANVRPAPPLGNAT